MRRSSEPGLSAGGDTTSPPRSKSGSGHGKPGRRGRGGSESDGDADVVQQGNHDHKFKPHNYGAPSYCHLCKGFLWGVIKQGLQCQVCGYNTHRRCEPGVPPGCPGAKKVTGTVAPAGFADANEAPTIDYCLRAASSLVPRMPTALESAMKKGKKIQPVRMSKMAADKLIRDTAKLGCLYPDGAYLFFSAAASTAFEAVHIGYRLLGMVHIEEIEVQSDGFADDDVFFIKGSPRSFASLDELRDYYSTHAVDKKSRSEPKVRLGTQIELSALMDSTVGSQLVKDAMACSAKSALPGPMVKVLPGGNSTKAQSQSEKDIVTFSYQSEDSTAVVEYTQVILDTDKYEPYIRNAKESGGDWWVQWSNKLEQSTHALVVYSDTYRKKLKLDFGPGGKREDSPLYREATAILRQTYKPAHKSGGVQFRALVFDPALLDERPIYLFRELMRSESGTDLGIKKWKDFLETLRSGTGMNSVPAPKPRYMNVVDGVETTYNEPVLFKPKKIGGFSAAAMLGLEPSIDRSQKPRGASSGTWEPEQGIERSRKGSSMYSDRYTPLECTEASTTAMSPTVAIPSARRRKTVRHLQNISPREAANLPEEEQGKPFAEEVWMFDRAFQCFKDMGACEGVIESCRCQTTAEGGIPIDETHVMVPDGDRDVEEGGAGTIAPYFSKLWEQAGETLLTPDYCPRQQQQQRQRKEDSKLPSDFKQKLQDIFTLSSHVFMHVYKFHSNELNQEQIAKMDISFVGMYYFAIRWGSRNPGYIDLIPEKELLLMEPILRAKKPSLPPASVERFMTPAAIFGKYARTIASLQQTNTSAVDDCDGFGDVDDAAVVMYATGMDQTNEFDMYYDPDELQLVESGNASPASLRKVTGAQFSPGKAQRLTTMYRMNSVAVEDGSLSMSGVSLAPSEHLEVLSLEDIQANWYVCDRSLATIKYWVFKADAGQFLISKVKFRDVYRVCVKDRNAKLMLFTCSHVTGSTKNKNFLFQHKIYFRSLTELVGVLQSKGVTSKDDGKVLLLTTAAEYADESNGLEDAVSLRKQKMFDTMPLWSHAKDAALGRPPSTSDRAPIKTATSDAGGGAFGIGNSSKVQKAPSVYSGFSSSKIQKAPSVYSGFSSSEIQKAPSVFASDTDGFGSDGFGSDGFGSDGEEGSSTASRSVSGVQSRRTPVLGKELDASVDTSGSGA